MGCWRFRREFMCGITKGWSFLPLVWVFYYLRLYSFRVFDCCFTTDVLEDDEYKVYMGGIVVQLRDHFPDASFMVFNFREGENQSQTAGILSEYDMTVIDYPRHYEGCPLLTMEMIHHCLRSGESWLSLGQQNLLLMHCERGGWPVLAFMLAALLVYRKQYLGEQKTLDMIYKQAPRELLQLLSPLNPLPSQLRYLQYISRRNVGSEWPPLDRALTLDCVILRNIPGFNGEGGCRPIFRIYGQDPFIALDRTPKVLFSTPKKSKLVRLYKQADCELVKIDIHCHIQGDVLLECISLDEDLEREEMMFRVMFNTAFIRSNILMLNRDEIDILWDAKDRFPKDFRAEVLLSEMDATNQLITMELASTGEKEGLPVEAFAKVQEIFSNVDWLDAKGDAALQLLQQITLSSSFGEKRDALSPRKEEIEILKEKLSPKIRQDKVQSDTTITETRSEQPAKQQSVLSPKNYTDSIQAAFSPRKEEIDTLKEKLSPEIQQEKVQSGNSSITESRSEQPPKQLSIPSPKSSTDSNRVAFSPQREEINACKEKSRPKFHEEKQQSENSIFMEIRSEQRPKQQFVPSPKSSGDSIPRSQTAQLHEKPVTLKSASQVKIISQRIPASRSTPVLSSNSVSGSVKTVSRFHSAPSALGITALLQDHAEFVRSDNSSSAVISPNVQSLSTGAANGPSRPCTPSRSSPPKGQASQLSTSASSIEKVSAATSSGAPVKAPPPLPPPQTSPSPPLPPTPAPRTSPSSPPPPPPPPQTSPPPPPSPSPPPQTSPPPPPPPPPPPQTSASPPPPPPPPPPPSLPPRMSENKNSIPSSSKDINRPTVKDKLSLMPPTPPPPPPPPPPLVPNLPRLDPTNSVPPTYQTSSNNTTSKKSLPTPPPPPPFTALPQPSKKPPTVANAPPLPPPPPSSSAPSAPPPPPPPHSSSKNSAGPASKTTPTPPVPPPPSLAPPFLKESSSSGKKGSGGDAAPPPPPNGMNPPSLGGRGRGMTRAATRGMQSNQSSAKRANLKPLHWVKVTRAMQGSLWAEAQKSDEALTAPDFDMSELENLFSAAVPNSDSRGSAEKSSGRSAGSRSEKVHLIDLRRANNCGIMLTKVKMPLSDLMVENLIKFTPTKEEMELLKGYNGDKESLGECERYFLELMKVPRVESKLRVFSFKIHFRSQVSDLRRNLNIVNSAAEEIRSSMKLKRIMQTILSLGNALNQGTARGSAVGFRLDSLLKLSDTRARNNKMTLMHYLCKVLADKLPELLDFPKDLVSLEVASKIQLKFLAEEMQAVSKGLEKVEQELTASENDGPVSETFRKTLKTFLNVAEAEVRALTSLYSNVGRNADALALYFGEGPARCPFEQVVSTLLNFVRMFIRAHNENCKQLELEKKKAQKEAENEKKLSNSKKELENVLHSPKSANIK
ncbi:formin-like protein 6 isoform X3 [Ananas comosus]|uniref:Formin-like protein n=1 Tax=Ananas comosus TaxID=4615 RepID=A0A6P5GBZ4_ANACO|nr:formin-like protein 6 isoform X3 [Ananas comosus]